MLKYLHIENIAVIESTDIDLKDGLNASLGRENVYEAMSGVKFSIP